MFLKYTFYENTKKIIDKWWEKKYIRVEKKLRQDNKLETKVIINKNTLKYKLLGKRIIINNRENYLE